MADSPFEEMAREAVVDTSRVPSDDKLKRAANLAGRMVRLQRLIRDLEAQTKKANVELYDLQTRDMPDLLTEIGTDRVGVPGEGDEPGYDVELSTLTHAAILSDWEQERKDAAFKHLDDLDAGDLIKNTITVTFPRGHDDERQEWLRKVRGLNLDFDPPELVESRTVPWNTLTAWVKEQLRKGNKELVLEKIGATHGTFAVINKRK